MFEPNNDEKHKDAAESVEDKNKAKTLRSKDKMNGSKIWENIEFSDDSDDFVDQRKSKLSSQKKESSFSFTKPAVADSNNKWNLKPLNSSINKSKLKQTKLTLEKKVSKVDITQVEGFNGGVMPSGNSKAKESREEPKKYIIEETQELENDSDDEDATRKRPSNARRESQDMHSDSGKSFNLLTLPEESMFIPNAVSTQKTKNQNKNSNSCKQSMSSRQSCRSKTNTTSLSPPSIIRSPAKANCRTPPNAFKTPSTRTSSGACSSTSRAGRSGAKKTLFLPKESKYDVDYTSQWRCPECIDYFVEGYGVQLLKMRPPPKKCGHSNKYPATPPDFWDPMCS